MAFQGPDLRVRVESGSTIAFSKKNQRQAISFAYTSYDAGSKIAKDVLE